MNINVTGINNTTGIDNGAVQGQTTAGNIAAGRLQAPVTPQAAREAGLRLLMNLDSGDVFTGEITNITNNEITIALSDSATVSALLSDALSYNIGDIASFAIKDNSGERIILKSVNNPGMKNLMNDQTIRSAIQNAGLSMNETTVSLVHNLMKQGQPIDAATLNNYVKLLDSVPDATPEDVVLMTRMGIPVTEENVASLHDYYDFSEGMTAKADNISSELNTLIVSMTEENPAQAAEVLKDFVNNFSEPVSVSEPLVNLFKPEELENISDNIIQFEAADDIENENVISDTTRNMVEDITTKLTDGNITAKEFINEFAKLAARPDINKNGIDKFVKSDEFKKIIDEAVREQYFIRPEDINNVNVKKLYAKIINDSAGMNEQFGSNSGMSAMLDNMNNASSDAQFLNNLNQFMNFVQLPVRMAGKNAHGDLYVYSRRGTKTSSPDEIKALLHLDMDNLGPMDVLVKLKQKNVTTNFKVADDKILQYVEEHMDELTARLNKLGYNVDNVVELNTTPYTFKSSVIENELPPAQIKRFSFDVRA
ncbi:MAG: flagellar hook-length control protein FliK [Lachnospiraceae bacterium]|nr:flagellar hook-length control protein FliK [Lachnospiraceae bacterium]